MNRGAVLVLVLSLGLLPLCAWSADDPDKPEPPVRLRKKARPPEEEKAKSEPKDKAEKKTKPEADDKGPEKVKPRIEPLRPGKQPDRPGLKRDGPGDDGPEGLKEQGPDPKEILARINKEMRRAETQLAKKDAGADTRQAQQDAVKGLDALIEQERRRQQQQQQQQQNNRSSRSQRQRNSRRQQQRAEQEQPMPQPESGSDGRMGGRSKGERSKIADLYKDIWGHLPETLRQEMDTYSRERFMAKYSDLLKQYYSAIAEKGRKQGE